MPTTCIRSSAFARWKTRLAGWPFKTTTAIDSPCKGCAALQQSDDAIDVLQDGVDRSTASCGIREGPPLGAEARTRLPFRVFLEIAYRFENNPGTCAFTDGVPSAQDA